MNFKGRLNRENFYFSSQRFQFDGILAVYESRQNTKFQLNISKIMSVRPKIHRDMVCE